MPENNVANEIRNGFNVMAGGIKEAGQRRVIELVEKQGYVGYRNSDAAALFHQNPEYADWTCQLVDGEYRFYPPVQRKEQTLETLQVMSDNVKQNESETNVIDTKAIVDTYENMLNDQTKTTFISVQTLNEDSKKCRCIFTSMDKQTGARTTEKDFVTDFEGQFALEILPSLYNKFMGGFPVVDHEKGQTNQRYISFQDVTAKRTMAFGNLTDEQLALVKEMKNFVDNRYFMEPEQNSFGKK